MVNLDTIKIKEIKKILAKNNIETTGEETDPNELQIKNDNEDDFSIYIKIDKENNSLRIHGISHSILSSRRKSFEGNELLEAINMMNIGSNITKYSSVSGVILAFEYGMFLSGDLSEDHLIKTVNFIIDEVGVLGGIFDEFLKIVRKLKK